MTDRIRFLRAIAGGFETVHELSAAIGRQPRDVRTVLAELAHRGEASEFDGRWWLTDRGRAALAHATAKGGAS